MRKPKSSREIYNDLDGEIVNLFQVVRDRGDDLIRLLELTPFSREEFKLSYEPAKNPLEQARRTIYRSFSGFGSSSVSGVITGFRANSNRSGTIPSQDWRNYPYNIPAIINRLRGVVIENRDALELLRQHDSRETLHYLDPPYMPETRTSLKGYRHEMTEEDHERLLMGIKTMKGMIIISGYENALYNDYLTDWRRIKTTALTDAKDKKTEVLWISPNSINQSLF